MCLARFLCDPFTPVLIFRAVADVIDFDAFSDDVIREIVAIDVVSSVSPAEYSGAAGLGWRNSKGGSAR
jgi:hypothetical protein